MKKLLLGIAVATLFPLTPGDVARASTAVIDSFDYGPTYVVLPPGGGPREISGSTFDSRINNQLRGSDNTRYWWLRAHETSWSIIDIPGNGFATFSQGNAAGWQLAYRYPAPTDLTGFTTLNVLGVGGGADEEPCGWRISLVDSDGDEWGTVFQVVSHWPDPPTYMYVDLANMSRFKQGGDGVLNLAEIGGIYLRGYCPGWGAYGMHEISLTRASVDQLLTALLGRVVGVGPGRSLANKIRHAQAYYAADDLGATCAMLERFINEVEAQTGKKIAKSLAVDLVEDATVIRGELGCE